MLISMNWIRDFVEIEDKEVDRLIKKFTLSTAEVDGVYQKGIDTQKVIAAEIRTVDDCPKAGKNRLLTVDTGKGAVQVVCGAANVKAGMRVAFCKEGGKVQGKPIVRAVISGAESFGMCCSEAELGISNDNSGLMEVPSDIALGYDLIKEFGLRDTVFEVDNKSLTNRPDLWGHYGIAREFAVLAGKPLKALPQDDLKKYEKLPELPIEIKSSEVYRYSAIKIENVREKVSPIKMKVRLTYCDMRPINLLADLTNYVMLEVGQPMHAFDAKKIGDIEVKSFGKEIKFRTLDGAERNVPAEGVMICAGDNPIAVAGIMGGANSDIDGTTDALVLESANFDAVSVRKTSAKIKLRTDSSLRYEKALDPEYCSTATGRFLALLRSVDSGIKVVSKYTDKYPKKYPVNTIEIDKKYIDRYTGIDIPEDTVTDTLKALGFGVAKKGGAYNVTVPSWRATKDVSIKADLVEEISRIYGYDNFVYATTSSPLAPVKLSAEKRIERKAQDLFVYRFNLHEVHSYVWCMDKEFKKLNIEAEGYLKLLNPQAAENSLIRKSLLPTLITMAAENKGYADGYGIFEIGRAVEGIKKDGTADERKKLGIALASYNGKENEEINLVNKIRDILQTLSSSTKGITLEFKAGKPLYAWQHPKICYEIFADGVKVGALSVLNPKNAVLIDKKACLATAEVDLKTFAEEVGIASVECREVSRYPGIDIDLTFAVGKDTVFADLEYAWKDLGCTELINVGVADIYKDESGKSITVRFEFSSLKKTLIKEDVHNVIDRITKNLAQKGIKIKGI